MGKHYSHMSSEERVMIQIEIENGSSLRSVARRLGRSLVSTIKRNTWMRIPPSLRPALPPEFSSPGFSAVGR